MMMLALVCVLYVCVCVCMYVLVGDKHVLREPLDQTVNDSELDHNSNSQGQVK
jgi:hypothetical protein